MATPVHEAAHTSRAPRLRMGFDLVQISSVAQSLADFGASYERRIFTEAESRYARSGEGLLAHRLAARFAAKEAVMKALQLTEAGVAWRDIEVIKLDSGDCDVALHGRAVQVARDMHVEQIVLSMSHDGDYAGANVCVVCGPAEHEFAL